MSSLVLALALALGPPVTFVRSLHREVPWSPSMPVKVVHRFGDLSVNAWTQDMVAVDAVVRAAADDERSAGELAKSIDLRLEVKGETILVRAVYPDRRQLDPEASYEMDVELGMPGRAVLVVQHSFGNVTAAGVSGGCRIGNRFGDVELERCRNCAVENRYGDVRVLSSAGELFVENSYGDVFLDGVSDRAKVDNRYGNVRSSGLEGVVQLGNRLGTVVARRSTGSLTVISRYGDVLAWVEDSALTDLEVVSELGQVELNLGRLVPFRLDGSTMRGDIRSSLPLALGQSGPRRLVSGSLGRGGPRIRLSGSWVDFFIQTPESTAEGRE